MPFKSSLVRSAGKLFGVFKERDLSLRGATQSDRMGTLPMSATGGTKIPAAASGNSYVYHVFLYGTSDNFVVNSGSANVDVLIIAGGGGGGWSYYAGGGGGGGVVYGPAIACVPGIYPITVGDKGTTPGVVSQRGVIGGNSIFNGVTAIGGAGGFGGSVTYPGSASGGSGGGCHGYSSSGPAIANVPQPVPGNYTAYGNQGGGSATYAGGGGGGASSAGGPSATRGPQSPGNYHFGGLGGAGRAFPGFPGPIIAPAIPTTAITDVPVSAGGPGPFTERVAFSAEVGPTGLYGGGGGGGIYYTMFPISDPSADGKPAGGVGGGGDGAGNNSGDPVIPRMGPARDAINHTGGGGGGGNYGAASFGKPGGTGIVLVRYI